MRGVAARLPPFHFPFKVSSKEIAFWRIGFRLIAMKARQERRLREFLEMKRWRSPAARLLRRELLLSDRGCAFRKIRWRDAKRLTELLQAARPDAVCSLLVILNLLERDTCGIGKFRMPCFFQNLLRHSQAFPDARRPKGRRRDPIWPVWITLGPFSRDLTFHLTDTLRHCTTTLKSLRHPTGRKRTARAPSNHQ
jgi:hypothetical protein